MRMRAVALDVGSDTISNSHDGLEGIM